eukprot:1761896-Amphidinium_carterae.2
MSTIHGGTGCTDPLAFAGVAGALALWSKVTRGRSCAAFAGALGVGGAGGDLGESISMGWSACLEACPCLGLRALRTRLAFFLAFSGLMVSLLEAATRGGLVLAWAGAAASLVV